MRNQEGLKGSNVDINLMVWWNQLYFYVFVFFDLKIFDQKCIYVVPINRIVSLGRV